jgi:hypothetical protein
VRGIDGAEVAVSLAVVEAVDHAGTAVVREVQRQALLAEGRLNLLQQRREIDLLRVDLVDDDHAIEVARGGVVHHPLRHRLDAGGRVDHDDRGLHRLQRRQRLADEVRGAGGVDQVHARAGVVQVQDRGVQRVLHAALERIVVADGATALEAADGADLAGLVQQVFGQTGLPSSRRSYQRQGPDGGDAGR